MRAVVLIMIVILGSVPVSAGDPLFRLAPQFTDNMVLQRSSSVPIWGQGVPGVRVALRASWGGRAGALTGADSTWNAVLRTPGAGGPFEIEVRYGDSAPVYINNVMSGEVWLCSGQSNMEMPLEGWPPADTVQNAAFEIRNAANCAIRFFTVRRSFSAAEERWCEGQWVESSPATAPGFSATAYFFAKALQRRLRVPIGLIHSSWGGTPVESWMAARAFARESAFAPILRKLSATVEGSARLHTWLAQFPVLDLQRLDPAARWTALRCEDDSCFAASYDDSRWPTMELPAYWESTDLGSFDGLVWFRRRVQIPPSWIGKELVLELGPIDDMDVTFVNGQRVGGIERDGSYKVDRIYTVPSAAVTDSMVQIAVRVIDVRGNGGLWGNTRAMRLSAAGSTQSIRLEGSWRCLPVAELSGSRLFICGATGERFLTRPPLAAEIGPGTPTTLFNAMIAPIAPFAIRGVIWYQGESNVDRPGEYERLFPAMIESWRALFNVPSLPFYYVQIAPYDYEREGPSYLLREAQLKTLALKNTGMAVTLDIGDAKNIHPANKRAVGERLARWALAKTYGRPVVFSGPLLRSVKARRGRLELLFDHAAGGLRVRRTATGNGFQIAGQDSLFREAVVTVRGSRLIVSHPEVSRPLAVRYAFTNMPEATLLNGDGLPASSFRTDNWTR